MADYYERALYNHILGQQDLRREWYLIFCFAVRHAQGVQHAGEFFLVLRGQRFREPCQICRKHLLSWGRLSVCQFVHSVRIGVERKGLNLRQEDPFPGRGNTRLTLALETPRRLAVKLRYPSWSGRPTVRVNGKSVRVKQHPGSYITLDRRWEDGDRIEVTYPMRLAMERMPDNPRKRVTLRTGRIGRCLRYGRNATACSVFQSFAVQ